MMEAVKNTFGENGHFVLIAAAAVVLVAVILIARKIAGGRNKQRAIFSNSKNKYKSRLGKKNINKYIYKQGRKK